MQTIERSLEHRVHHALAGCPYISRREMRFETEAGRVVLRGKVPSYFQKQMAQEALRRIDGIAEIENQLEVTWA